jgi:hypothetical protein
MYVENILQKLQENISINYGTIPGATNSVAYNQNWSSSRDGVPFHFYDPYNQIPLLQSSLIKSLINNANNEVLNRRQDTLPPLPQSAQPMTQYKDENEYENEDEDLYGQPMRQPYFDRNRLQYNPNRTWGEFVRGRGGKKRTRKSKKSRKSKKTRKTTRRK